MNYLKLAEKAGVNLALATPSYKKFLILYGELIADSAKNEEREKCAKLCDDWESDEAFIKNIAEAIREREQA